MNDTAAHAYLPRKLVGETPQVEVVIEIPKGSFLKRGSTGKIDFISPLPCPFNYGSVPEYIGLEGDLLDAVVLGPRLPRGSKVKVYAFGAVGLTDRDLYDDKLICSENTLRPCQQRAVVGAFRCYGWFKKLLNLWRARPGRTASEGWGDARVAIARAHRRGLEPWEGSSIPF